MWSLAEAAYVVGINNYTFEPHKPLEKFNMVNFKFDTKTFCP